MTADLDPPRMTPSAKTLMSPESMLHQSESPYRLLCRTRIWCRRLLFPANRRSLPLASRLFADAVSHDLLADVDIVTGLGLCRRSEDRLRKLLRLAQPGR